MFNLAEFLFMYTLLAFPRKFHNILPTLPSHVDPSLADVFSIGLTILSSGTLEDCDDVYKTSPYELRKDRLNSLLRVFKEKYSDYLFQTVASMLTLSPKNAGGSFSFNSQEGRKCSSMASFDSMKAIPY